jgi:hypothetical protein
MRSGFCLPMESAVRLRRTGAGSVPLAPSRTGMRRRGGNRIEGVGAGEGRASFCGERSGRGWCGKGNRERVIGFGFTRAIGALIFA